MKNKIKAILKELMEIWPTYIQLGLFYLIQYIVWYILKEEHFFLSDVFLEFLYFIEFVFSIYVIIKEININRLHNRIDHLTEEMNLAVIEQVRSERMKTELITNVSHDLKTPLTSMINYADLICQEPCENETITEYAKVLERQSVRLKRLIDDLVEASKANTGNLEVSLEPCNAEILLTQVSGEFEQKLSNAGMELKIIQPEAPVTIMADTRRLWRIFDNLMNNICKYGQPGTRVYLILETSDTHAVFTFKNTSRSELIFTAKELTERFVRGDLSRNTEGNGLGLAIAKSLTELQNGIFEIKIDGDLFKVILKFPKINSRGTSIS